MGSSHHRGTDRTVRGSAIRRIARHLRRTLARALGDEVDRPHPTERRLNVALLGATIVVGLAAVAAVWRLRQWQLGRIAERYYETATDAVEALDWRRADRNLRQYLALKPHDPSGLKQVAMVGEQLIAEPSDVPRAIRLYALAVGANPNDFDLRLRMGSLQLATAPEQSLDTARQLLAARPTDPAAQRLLAQSLDRLWTRDESGMVSAADLLAAYEDWIEAEPNNVAALGRLAMLCMAQDQRLAVETGRLALDFRYMARNLANRMVEQCPNDPAAYLARYAVRRRLAAGDGETSASGEINDDLTRALELAPRHPEANLAAAECLCPQAFDRPIGEPFPQPKTRNQLERCQACLLTAQQSAPADERPYLALAELGRLGGDLVGAWNVLQLALKQVPQPSPGLYLRLAEAAILRHQWDDASWAFGAADRAVHRLASLSRDAETTLHRHDFFATIEVLQAKLLADGENPGRDLAAASELLRSAATRPVSRELRERIRREATRLQRGQ